MMLMNERYKYSYASTLWKILMFSFLLCCSSACVFDKDLEEKCSDDDENVRMDSSKAFLSFDIYNDSFFSSEEKRDVSTRAAVSGTITETDYSTGTKEGTTDERKISCLWVLLFEKGAKAAESPLKYIFKFDKTSSFDNKNYEGKEGGIESLVTSSEASIYRTSVKLVDPGDYQLIVFANPTTHLVESLGDNQFAESSDFFERYSSTINTSSAPSFETVSKLLSSGTVSYQFPNGPRLHANDDPGMPMHGVMKGPFNDKDENVSGLPAYYVNENFNIPKGYGSPKFPLNEGVYLTRSQAKLLVTIDNLNDDATEQDRNSYKYKIKDIQLHMQDGFSLLPSQKYLYEGIRKENALKLRTLFASTYTYTDKGGQSQSVQLGGVNLTHFSLLESLMGNQGFQFFENKQMEERELFNVYIPPYTPTKASSSSPAYEPETSPTLNLETVPYIYFLVENKTNHKEFLYKIPIYSKENGQKVYKIKNNTLYKIHLRFHGVKLVRVHLKYTVDEYTPIEVNVPAFS